MKTFYPYQKICFTLVDDLQERAKDIVIQRFGLNNDEPQTLEAIGQDHGITRERIRQIVDDSLEAIKEKLERDKIRTALTEIFDHFSGTLKNAGHVKREDLLLEALRARDEANYVIFLLTLGNEFLKQRETENFHAFWGNKKEVFEITPRLTDSLLEYFQEKKTPVDLEELKTECGRRFSENLPRVVLSAFPSVLEVSKHIMQGHNGKWGLKEWPEVYPRGIREKAYLALKRTGQPQHFTKVAQLVAALQELLPTLPQKRVLPQTVHNELIKDPRFVLVGRGVYALSEWGYTPGTVKDVLSSIFQKAGRPMNKEEIIQKALEQRQVKESTVLLSLQDRERFSKTAEGNYYLS